jgi:hypothetical protein
MSVSICHYEEPGCPLFAPHGILWRIQPELPKLPKIGLCGSNPNYRSDRSRDTLRNMTLHNGENIWKLSLGAAVLVFFFCLGVAHTIYPDRFIKRSGVRKGGEMLTDFNRISFQIVGLIVAAFAGCLLYVLAGDILAK